jgi:CheY-like chemotaxis protein
MMPTCAVRSAVRLEALGYRVAEAGGGREALGIISKDAPNLAIIDYAMPEMTGAEVARAAAEICPGLPVVFASGYAESEALNEALGWDVPILRTPFTLAEIAELVAATLAKTQRRE